jgi:hypothetical protein
MTAARMRAVALAALACGAAVLALLAASDHQGAKGRVGDLRPRDRWSFIGVGLYAWRRRPESRTGALMVLLGFAWFLSALNFANSALLYSAAFVLGGLWGGSSCSWSWPSRRAGWRPAATARWSSRATSSSPWPRSRHAVRGPHELGCDGCPTNVLLIRPRRRSRAPRHRLSGPALRRPVRDRARPPRPALAAHRSARAACSSRRSTSAGCSPSCSRRRLAGAGDAAGWAAFIATALLPFAFLAGLLRSHVARLDADLRARVVELRASRARLVEAGDTERRRLERNLHDGAQARLVALALLLGHARRRVRPTRGDGRAARPRAWSS